MKRPSIYQQLHFSNENNTDNYPTTIERRVWV